MGKRPLMIGSYRDVPVGPKIVELVKTFDSDAKTRALVLGYRNHLGSVGELPDLDVAEEKYRDYRLNELVSCVWDREKCLGLLAHISLVRDDLIGGQGNLAYGFDPEQIATLRRQWRDHPVLHEQVSALTSALEQAAFGYNVQLLATLIGNTRLDLLKKMDLRGQQEVEDLLYDLNLVANRGYFDGNHRLNDVGRAMREVYQLAPTDTILSDLLVLDDEDALALACERMGLEPPKKARQRSEANSPAASSLIWTPRAGDSGLLDVVTLDVSEFEQGNAGILVPKNFGIFKP